MIAKLYIKNKLFLITTMEAPVQEILYVPILGVNSRAKVAFALVLCVVKGRQEKIEIIEVIYKKVERTNGSKDRTRNPTEDAS